MEQKKFDLNSFIGFALIFGIIFWMMMNSQKNEAKEQKEKAKKEQLKKQQNSKQNEAKLASTIATDSTVSDTLKLQKLQSTLGSFAYSATLPSAKENFTILENEVLKLR